MLGFEAQPNLQAAGAANRASRDAVQKAIEAEKELEAATATRERQEALGNK